MVRAPGRRSGHAVTPAGWSICSASAWGRSRRRITRYARTDVPTSQHKGLAQKCTLCYDRQQNGLEPACAKACPTKSIQFGEVDELVARAGARVRTLHAVGVREAHIYGVPGDGYTDDIGGLNAIHLLLDKPGVYGLPDRPQLGSRATVPSQVGGVLAGALVALGAAFSFRNRGRAREVAEGAGREGGD